MRERTVEQHLVNRVEQTGGLVRKVQWTRRRAAPDRLVGWPEHLCVIDSGVDWDIVEVPMRRAQHFLIETKAPGKSARPEQEREHERLRAIGFDVRVLDTIEKVDAFVMEVVGR